MKKKLLKEITLGLIIASLCLIVGLTILVHFHPVLDFDVRISKDLQSNTDGLNETFAFYVLSFVSFLGRTTVAVWIILGASLIFWLQKYYWETLFCLLTSLSALINSGFKFLIGRPRPDMNLVNILDHEISPSYPSGHVVFFTVFFGFLIAAMFFTKKIPRLMRVFIASTSGALIILVSLSRIYLGAHWLTDVIAGYLLGIVLLSILLYFYLRDYLNRAKV
jgi:undecaprenyl-diphosphatase